MHNVNNSLPITRSTNRAILLKQIVVQMKYTSSGPRLPLGQISHCCCILQNPTSCEGRDLSLGPESPWDAVNKLNASVLQMLKSGTTVYWPERIFRKEVRVLHCTGVWRKRVDPALLLGDMSFQGWREAKNEFRNGMMVCLVSSSYSTSGLKTSARWKTPRKSTFGRFVQ